MSKNYNCYHVLDQIFLPWGPTSWTTSSPFVSLTASSRGSTSLSTSGLLQFTAESWSHECWLDLFSFFSELIHVIKFGLELFSKTQISKMVLWLAHNILVSVVWVFALMEI